MLNQFRVARYRFAIEAFEPLRLPPNKGSTLRGGFGHALRRLTCLYPNRPRCAECDHHPDCVYGYIFETAPARDAEVLRNLEAVPLPFVVEPLLDDRSNIPAGDGLEFGLVLIGRANRYLPYFILGFRELGRQGLGADRGRYVLQRVLARHPWSGHEQILFDGVDIRVSSDAYSVNYAEIAHRAQDLPAEQLTIDLMTPTRLKHEGRWVWEAPSFHVLVRRLLDRVSSLAYFHCGERWDIDFRAWIDRACAVERVQDETEWRDWERFSGRQQQRVRLGGLVGRVTYAGDLAPFLPLLALGQWTHVGKGAVFGSGQYTILP